MKMKISKLMKVSYMDGKLFMVVINWMWKARHYLQNEVEDTLYCDELADKIFDYGYRMDLIFNADKTGLNYRMLPIKSLAMKAGREPPRAIKWKEHETVLTCANASKSFRLSLLVIGKSMKSRTLKNHHQLCIVNDQKSAWMDVQLL